LKNRQFTSLNVIIITTRRGDIYHVTFPAAFGPLGKDRIKDRAVILSQQCHVSTGSARICRHQLKCVLTWNTRSFCSLLYTSRSTLHTVSQYAFFYYHEDL